MPAVKRVMLILAKTEWPPTETLPDRVGKYRIVRQIGRGATSRVFLAEDTFFDRLVAVKVIRREAGDDSNMRNRFRRVFMNEAALTGKLSHPHIIGIYDAVAEDDESYLVMEYVDGQTLDDFCSPDRLLPMEKVVEIAFKASLALDYACRHGVIHCDVKPANILLTRDTDIKLTDFGAALYEEADHTQLTGIGSPAYMSPEQVQERQLTHQTDIYSLGVVLYQLLTGRLPFQGSNRGSLLYQIINVDPLPPSVHRLDVPAELERIVLRALAKRPGERYGSWAEMSRDLANAFKHLTLPSDAVSDTEKFSAVRGLSFFDDFVDLELWETLRLAQWHRYPGGTTILHEGDTGDGFFVLIAGEAVATRNGNVLDVLREGHCFGEILYFEPRQEPRTTTIATRTPCIALEIKATSLRQASERTRMQFNCAFLRVLVNRIEKRETRILTQIGTAAASA